MRTNNLPGIYRENADALKDKGYSSLLDIANSSFSVFRRKSADELSSSKARKLHRTARQYTAKRKLRETRAVTRSSGQLRNTAVMKTAATDNGQGGYEQRFGRSDTAYVSPDSVASLFSPGAYLTELYREGKGLHPTSDPRSLDSRRPDLKNLVLSQSNQDEEVTTLALSNEILRAACGDDTEDQLAVACYPFALPYDQSFARVSAVLEAHHTSFDDLAQSVSYDGINEDLGALFANQINPALQQLLVEAIPSDSTGLAAMLEKHFGAGATRDQLSDIEYLCERASISRDELNQYLTMPVFERGHSTLASAAISNKPLSPGAYGGAYLGYSSMDDGSCMVFVQHSGRLTPYVVSWNEYENWKYMESFDVLPSLMDGHVMLSCASALSDDAGDLSISIEIDGELETVLRQDVDPAHPIAGRYFKAHVRAAKQFKFILDRGGASNRASLTLSLEAADDIFFQASCIRLSKLIRFSRATGLSPETLDNLIRLSTRPSDLHHSEWWLGITSDTLYFTAKMLQYMRRYSIDQDDALVLLGGYINVCAPAGKLSQFDRLFNNPPLNQQLFEINKTSDAAPIDCNQEGDADAHDRAALKRAFGVDDAGLARLSRDGFIERNLMRLSHAYRVCLFASVHKWTMDQLTLANRCLVTPNDGLWPLADFDKTDRSVEELYDLAQWLDSEKLSVEALHAMTTTTYPTTLTSEIKRFLRVLYDALGGDTKLTMSDGELVSMFAPHATAQFGLANTEMGVKLQYWLTSIAQERGLHARTIREFATVIVSLCEDVPDTDTVCLAEFCQALGQLALIIKTWRLNTVDLGFIVDSPGKLQSGLDSIDATSRNLRLISRFKHWQARLGERVNVGLDALRGGSLSPTLLASLLGASDAEIQNAWGYVVENGNGDDSLPSATDGIAISEWLQTAQAMNMSVKTLHDLLVLNDSVGWQSVAADLLASVPPSETEAMNGQLDEQLSAALCARYLDAYAPAEVNNRDDIYQRLLIDNQVSSEVKTARIAEAITSVQLYINRCLQGVESGVASEAQFFEYWEQYNRRYSTWAGVSQLVYYPENYLDPSLRYNQSHLMRELQQEINQNKLTKDSVDTAYLNYLDKFEEIANLKVLCGYHHSVQLDQGKMYFVARTNAEPYQYHWRQLDMDEADQELIGAWAWNDWEKIDCPMQPFNNEVRPVIFNNRLYVGWVEKTKKTDVAEGDANTNNKKITYDYALNLSYRKINGSWSAPVSFILEGGVLAGDAKEAWLKQANLHLTGRASKNTILVSLYEPLANESNYTVSNNLSMCEIDDSFTQHGIDSGERQQYLDLFSNNLNTTSNPRKVVRYIADSYTFSYEQEDPVDGTKGVITTNGVSINGEFDYDSIPPILTVRTNATVNIIETPIIPRGFSSIPKGWVEGGVTTFYDVSSLKMMPVDRAASNFHKMEPFTGWFSPGENTCFVLYKVTVPAQKYSPPQRSEVNVGEDVDHLCQIWAGDQGLNIGDERSSGSVALQVIAIDDEGDGSAGNISYHLYHYTFWLLLKKCKIYELTYYFGDRFETAWELDSAAGNVVDANKNWSLHGLELSVDWAYSFGKTQGTLGKRGEAKLSGIVCQQDISGNSAVFPATLRIYSAGMEYTQQFTFTAAHDKGAIKNPTDGYLIKQDNNGAEYLASTTAPRRLRLNTLFANELIKRAQQGGLDGVLSWETQQLQEPQPGEGFYATLIFNASPATNDNALSLQIVAVASDGKAAGALYAGALEQDAETTVTVFVPVPYSANEKIDEARIAACYGGGAKTPEIIFRKKGEVWALDATHNGGAFNGLKSVKVLPIHTEPMDFNGANGLYFWELFYYTPMLVAQRLVQERNYEEAERWLKYIFRPGGYQDGNGNNDRCWNVRPLQEDTAWDAMSLDATDPDAVAMADPMHYKVSTFMKQLDMLIGRGDDAYRMLERDTLAEAKMDYVRALHLLGEEPDIPQAAAWPEPKLLTAAARTGGAALQTANTLTALFMPCKNTVLADYWQTLRQRLYNLRHNLSIDGQALNLPLYANPIDPKKLQSAAASGNAGSEGGGPGHIALHRFPVMLESARTLVSQLIQYGATLSSILERKDAEAMSVLMQTQAVDLMETSIALQDKAIEQLANEQAALEVNRAGAQARLGSYQVLLDEGVSSNEQLAMNLRQGALASTEAANALRIAGGALNMAPNVFGLADGGDEWGAALLAGAGVADMITAATQTQADGLQTAEQYRRRGQEWEIQRDNAKYEALQFEAQKKTLAVQAKAAELQKKYLQTEQSHTQTQLDFLKSKFTNEALYSWMHGRLSALFYQFYDLAAARCRIAELGYQWETQRAKTFIQPGVWDSNHAGLLAGESLQLNLAKMESDYLSWDSRALEVLRTVSMAQAMAKAGAAFDFNAAVKAALTSGRAQGKAHTLELKGGTMLASVNISKLKIDADYPMKGKPVRRIKQISVSLPALLGPYQDVQAVLQYSGANASIHQSCKQTAISHGINDSGQFQLDFNDSKYLPFEGLPIVGDDSASCLTLSFPNAGEGGKQRELLNSLNDIILHIRYTIRS